MKLNDINDEGAAELSAFYEKLLTETKNSLTAYEAHFNIGMVAWRSGNGYQCREHLHIAACQFVAHLKTLGLPQSGEPRSIHSVALPFLVIFNFGGRDMHQALASIDHRCYSHPDTIEYRALSEMLELLRQYFAGRSFGAETLNRIIEINQHESSAAFYRPCLSSMAHGMLAILEQNDILLEKCLNHLLQLHEHLAHEGGWQRLAEGLMSLWTLTLKTIATREGVACSFNSAYVPELPS